MATLATPPAFTPEPRASAHPFAFPFHFPSPIQEHLMPLQFINDRGNDRLTVACDHCGEPIPDGKQGNYQWRPGGVVRYTHRHCSLAFERANGGGADWWALPLDVLPIHLGDTILGP